MKIKPALPKGTRDFLPKEVARRNYIFDTIKSVFRKYGFEQIETPAFETLQTLAGKYGDEGDKLLFKILNSGEYLDKAKRELPNVSFTDLTSKQLTPQISEKGLRYDHTVPLARYVVQHQDELAFPFKRFAVGPVWRADKPQKGRYQEFYQFDADVIGSSSLLNEVELTMIYAEVFKLLNIPATIRFTNRILIEEVLSKNGINENRNQVIGLIDKLDKVAWEGEKGIAAQLLQLGLTQVQVAALNDYVLNTTYLNYKEKVTNLDGLYDIEFMMSYFKDEPMVKFDPTLMRGLDYYTGTVWEIALNNNTVSIGSLGGGGRYDNLTEIFGAQGMTGVGISFGIERLYIVMDELGLFPESLAGGVKVLFVPRDSDVEEFTFNQVKALREAGIPAEIFLGNVKKQKHFPYAEQKGITYLIEVGANEVESKSFRLRHVKERREEGAGFTLESLIQKLA